MAVCSDTDNSFHSPDDMDRPTESCMQKFRLYETRSVMMGPYFAGYVNLRHLVKISSV